MIGKKAKKLQADYRYKKKVSWAFAALSFLLATFVFMLLASVVTYNAYVKAFDQNPLAPSLSYASLLWKGISAPFKITNITEYTEYNAANVLAWLLPLKAATVYDGHPRNGFLPLSRLECFDELRRIRSLFGGVCVFDGQRGVRDVHGKSRRAYQ